jgi:hydroxyethylthiazole kinase-like uncharacterized protein yjeF
MKPIYLVDQVRAAEQATGAELTDGRLMAKAAAGLAREVVAELAERGLRPRGARILLVVGPGDNGGDGLLAAAELARRGARVRVWRTSDRVHAGGWVTLTRAGGRPLGPVAAVAALPETDLVIDAVFGIGARPGLPPGVTEFAEACRAVGVPVVAADLPSGLVADDAGPSGPSFHATRTVSFGAWKPCHELEPARSRCGVRRLIDIGLDLPQPTYWAVEMADLAAAWPWPNATSDKYSRGVVGVDTGSLDYPGAAVLSVLGATYAGAGLVRYIGPVREVVLAAAPNVVAPPVVHETPAWPGLIPTVPGSRLADLKVQAWVIGSGWGSRPDGVAQVVEVLNHGAPLVVDAEAIGLYVERVQAIPGRAREVLGRALLTPHAGELARLLGWSREDVQTRPAAAVQAACRQTGATVLLKGATQYVATPGDPTTYLCFPGPAWTAQAGSGDVLAGICGALLAAGQPPLWAALLGGSIQALAAARHLGPYPPQDLVRHLPAVIASLRPGSR